MFFNKFNRRFECYKTPILEKILEKNLAVKFLIIFIDSFILLEIKIELKALLSSETNAKSLNLKKFAVKENLILSTYQGESFCIRKHDL